MMSVTALTCQNSSGYIVGAHTCALQLDAVQLLRFCRRIAMQIISADTPAPGLSAAYALGVQLLIRGVCTRKQSFRSDINLKGEGKTLAFFYALFGSENVTSVRRYIYNEILTE